MTKVASALIPQEVVIKVTRVFCQTVLHTVSARPLRSAILRLIPRTALLPWLSSRAVSVSEWPLLSSPPRDYSLPNPSWSTEMRRLYEYYDSLCEKEMEGGEKKPGGWGRLPSYNRTLKYAAGGKCLSKLLKEKARLFTRNTEEQGAAFEYVVFMNKSEKRCVCIFQAGHLLEGPPGNVHGGAIATIIDTSLGTLAGYLSGIVMTANLNINYCSPIPLGSVVLIDSVLDKVEGRKTFVSCQVTSSDGSKLHTEATGLFISINVGHLFGG
ncbi:acyl-coenzyme A thioesterase THEM4 isoform X2 [Paramormyrops kingsleyae]|uniref:acyl-coenzyme A thioesterase THEM4 isoform X2 n=1 Tax=Paramormyrops kingsleyae TaxID=1676925 RepID=UPI000CD5CB46|nr:acyl-coenzyme A thioesterase THEM4-like isoform X2 [Paramormyrops kingsleyae]